MLLSHSSLNPHGDRSYTTHSFRRGLEGTTPGAISLQFWVPHQSILVLWQASQEVEEEKSMGRRLLVSRKGASKREIQDWELDVVVGSFFPVSSCTSRF